jgi:hypothetical protein
MASTIKVDNVQNQPGNNLINRCSATTTVGSGAGNTINVDGATVTIGRCGGTVSLASGATQSGFGRTGTVDWETTVQTSTITVANGKGYFVNTTSGSITANLPAGSAGSICAFKDYAGTFDTNKLVISPNGSEKINGVAANYEAETESLSITLLYVDATKGWIDIHDSTEAASGGAYITATGGTISTVCTNYKVHVFTGPGTFCVSAGGGPKGQADYLVLAGGGGGGWEYHGGGGGAGGYRESHCATTSGPYTASPAASGTSLTLSPGPYSITVGAGGAASTGAPCGGSFDGSNSVFSTITSAGGGGGGSQGGPAPTGPGNDGGSGGGGTNVPICTTFGDGNVPPVSPPQGNPGGKYSPPGGNWGAGAGGGAGAAGGNGSTSNGGTGGAGLTSSITASPVTRGGGGGGSTYNGGTAGPGGPGGGGNGTTGNSSNGTAGTVNLGGGGGGGERSVPNTNGWAGGSGVVVIRYRFQ